MNVLEWAFGRSKTPQERLRQHQRSLEKAQRELDRERQKLEQQEKRLISEIKRAAKEGQTGAARVKARDLVRTRKHVRKFYSMKTQLQAVSLRILTVRSNEQMMQSMRGATRLLGGMNRRMNLPALSRIAQEFERENDMMDQRQEMMDDAIDESMEDDEEETDEVVNQVMDELGVDLAQSLGVTPSTIRADAASTTVEDQRVPQAMGAGGAGAGAADDDLQARLDRMRR